MASNVVDTYAWLASRHLPVGRRARFVADLVREAPSLLALDRRDRGDFLRSFYLRFEDAPIAQLRTDSWQLFHLQLLTRSFPEGFARVRAHRALGHRTLLITGALDFIIEPVRPLFDDIVCAHMEVRQEFVDRPLDQPAPDPGEATLPRAGRLRTRTICRWKSRWPMPTRPATWPCWKQSGSRWRSTPGAPGRHCPPTRLARGALGEEGTGAAPTGRCRWDRSMWKSPKAVTAK